MRRRRLAVDTGESRLRRAVSSCLGAGRCLVRLVGERGAMGIVPQPRGGAFGAVEVGGVLL